MEPTPRDPLLTPIIRWLVLWMLLLELIGWRNFSAGVLGERFSLIEDWSGFARTMTHSVLSAFFVFALTYWNRLSFREMFGPIPSSKDTICAIVVGVGMLLIMIWADTWAEPRIRSFLQFETTSSHPMEKSTAGVWWLGLFIASFVAPVGEEVFFRGLLYQGVASFVGALSAVVVSAVAFGACHDRFLGPFLFGLVLCLLYQRTASLFMCVIAHCVANLLGFSGSGSRGPADNSLAGAGFDQNAMITLASGVAILGVMWQYLLPSNARIPCVRNREANARI